MSCIVHLHLIVCEHCRCFRCTLYIELGNHTEWSCNTNRCYMTCPESTTFTVGLLKKCFWPSERPHLEKFVHNSTLHLAEEKPCLRERLSQSTLEIVMYVVYVQEREENILEASIEKGQNKLQLTNCCCKLAVLRFLGGLILLLKYCICWILLQCMFKVHVQLVDLIFIVIV